MKNIRLNKDIKYIIIHHTVLANTGMEINKEFNKNGLFGVPYDVVINFNGSVDLSPRWTHNSNSNIYIMNVRIKDIFKKYVIHYLAGLDINDYNEKGFHIAIVGNFDVSKPSILQYDSLKTLLEEAALKLGISLNTSLLYYSEIFNTTSPGNLFINKTKLF